MNALFLLVILATAYGERGDLRLTSGGENHGIIQIAETDAFRSACLGDNIFSDTEALIACRQLDFQYVINHVEGEDTKPPPRVAVVQDFTCTEDNVKLIECMQLQFIDTATQDGFICKNVQLTCSNTAPPTTTTVAPPKTTTFAPTTPPTTRPTTLAPPTTTTFAPKSTSVGNGIRGKVEQHNDSSAVTRSSMVIVLLMVIAAVVFNNQDD